MEIDVDMLCYQVKHIDIESSLRKDVLHIIRCFEAGIPSLYKFEALPCSCNNPCYTYTQILDILKEFNYLVHLTDMIPLIDEYLEYVTFKY